ncbi:ATP synthase protein I [Methylocella tundrae]|uniref:ATP synthase protein I n=1 Tax=Methylocella tundrae TaxID=227605 RepID=A0A4U8Z035_METTU|nr:ATP synthase protein I [Methylocella tundrae]
MLAFRSEATYKTLPRLFVRRLETEADAVGERDDSRSEDQKRADARFEADQREAAALRSRLDKLSADLGASKDSSAGNGDKDADLTAGSFGGAMSLGFRVLTEFVSAVVVGALIGWQLDKWFGTSPLFLLVLLLMGTAAGFWNVYRIAVKPPGTKP